MVLTTVDVHRLLLPYLNGKVKKGRMVAKGTCDVEPSKAKSRFRLLLLSASIESGLTSPVGVGRTHEIVRDQIPWKSYYGTYAARESTRSHDVDRT